MARPSLMPMIACVYGIRCTLTGKIYVGSTSNWPKRYRQHRYELNRGTSRLRHLQAAWSKYGEDSFKISVLEVTHPDKDVLMEREKYYIDLYNASDPEHGLNCRSMPNTNLGVKFSEDFRERCRMRRASEDTRRKLSESHKGQKPSQKNIESRLAAVTGKSRTPEVREKISMAHKGKIVSKETRARISKAAKMAWAIRKREESL